MTAHGVRAAALEWFASLSTSEHLELDQRLRGVDSSLDAVMTALRDGGTPTDQLAEICGQLARTGDRRVAPVLSGALADRHPAIRAAAARSLVLVGGPEATTRLVRRMQQDDSPEVRKASAYALGHLGDRRAARPLITLLDDHAEHPAVRGAAAEALASFRGDQVEASLIAALGDASAEVRFWAAFALGEMGGPGAVPALARVAAHDPATLPGWWSVSKEAQDAIDCITERLSEADGQSRG